MTLRLRHPWAADGTTHVAFEPTAFLERLAVLVPRPRINLLLYHGVLAAHAAWRAEVVARAPCGGQLLRERDNRHRKPTRVGRLIRRLMLLDAVLSDERYYWLGTERDKFQYFDQVMKRDISRDWYPHIVFQHENNETVRLFPEKLPSGVDKDGRDHVFLYLATRPHPWDFRMFLLRHATLLQGGHRWRIRVLLPGRIP